MRAADLVCLPGILSVHLVLELVLELEFELEFALADLLGL